MRALLFSMLLSALAVAPASAERITDPEGSFEITWPSDWQPGLEPAYTEAFGPVDGPQDASCLAGRYASPGLEAATQEEINAEFRTPFTLREWEQISGAERLDAIEDLQVIDGPIVSQRVTATAPDATGTLRARMTFFARPGEIFFALCSVSAPDYPQAEPVFEAILDSFRPL